MTVQSRQKLLKDFRLIEILTEILYYPFQLNMFTLDNIHNNTFKTVILMSITPLKPQIDLSILL